MRYIFEGLGITIATSTFISHRHSSPSSRLSEFFVVCPRRSVLPPPKWSEVMSTPEDDYSREDKRLLGSIKWISLDEETEFSKKAHELAAIAVQKHSKVEGTTYEVMKILKCQVTLAAGYCYFVILQARATCGNVVDLLQVQGLNRVYDCWEIWGPYMVKRVLLSEEEIVSNKSEASGVAGEMKSAEPAVVSNKSAASGVAGEMKSAEPAIV